MTKAQQYLIDRKPDIKINYTENPVSETLEEVLQFLDYSIDNLKPLRLNDTSTKRVIVELLKTNNNVFIISWLIKALAYDKSFVYAYNYLAQIRNSVNGTVYPVVIPVDYIEIESLIANEEKGKSQNRSKPKTFNCKLKPKQVVLLAEHLNKAGLFEIKIDDNTLQSLFDCTLTKPLIVTNNRLLAFLFTQLENVFISKYWQSIIDKNNFFLSENGKHITSGDLSTAKNDNKTCNPKGSDSIDYAIAEIKKV